jgi:uncharacterized protein YjbI with pentapeptide repeats
MFRQVPWGKVLAWSGLLAAAVVVVVAAVYVIFWPVSDLIARHDVGAITGRGYGAALQTARDAARGRLVAFGAGLFAAGALIYTARNFALARQGQVTDRYTKAIEQLGSSKELDVRIGGIYALERIARDSRRDHPTIMEVLAAFIRDHSSERWPPAEPGAETPERATRPDVQAAVTVIRRNPRRREDRPRPVPGPRPLRPDRQRFDLHSVVLPGAVLTDAVLPDAVLTDAVLTMADLYGANLRGADLEGAPLNDADLDGADLRGANLRSAELDHASLPWAILDGADLFAAHLALAELTGADLRGVNFDHAVLTGANLRGVDLTGATLTSAVLDANFGGATLTSADLRYANVTGADFSGADLTGADLRHTNITDADLNDADLNGAMWPEGVPTPDGWMVVDTESGRLQRRGQLSEITAHYL